MRIWRERVDKITGEVVQLSLPFEMSIYPAPASDLQRFMNRCYKQPMTREQIWDALDDPDMRAWADRNRARLPPTRRGK